MRLAVLLILVCLESAAAQENPAPEPTDPVEMPVPRPEPAPEPQPEPQPAPAPLIKALIGATIIPGDGSEPITDGVVLIEGRGITAVGRRGEVAVPEGAEVTNLDGKYLMPGMIDAHVHFFQSGGLYARPDVFDLRDIVPYADEAAATRAAVDGNFQRYLAAGVTSVFDAGGPNTNFDVRQASRGARAPFLAMAGPLIATEPTPRQELMIIGDNQPIISAATTEEAANLARSLLPSNPDAIKIWGIGSGTDGAKRIEDMTRAIAAVTDEARIRVAVHATALENAKAALRGGADILVHSIDDKPVDDEFIRLMKQNDATLVTAMVVFEGYTDAATGRPRLSVEERRLADPDVLRSLYAMPEALRRDGTQRLGTELTLAQNNAKALMDAGVRVAMGTDAGNVGTLHGGSVFRELEILEAAGIAPPDIIRMATWNAAHVVADTPDFGVVRPGFRADLLVLDDSPLEDISNMASLETVWLRGHPFERRTLIARTPEAIVQEQLEAYNAHDLTAFGATFARNIRIYNLPDTDQPQVSGMDQLREVYGRLFDLPDAEKVQCQVVERMVEGNFVIDQERCRNPDGRTIRAEATAIYHIVDGQISRVWFAR